MNDAEWSRKVRERDNFRCVFGLRGCLGAASDACHIFSRGFQKLRFDIDNGLSGCRTCHSWCEVHKDKFLLLARSIIGENKWMSLVKKIEKYYGKKNK